MTTALMLYANSDVCCSYSGKYLAGYVAIVILAIVRAPLGRSTLLVVISQHRPLVINHGRQKRRKKQKNTKKQKKIEKIIFPERVFIFNSAPPLFLPSCKPATYLALADNFPLDPRALFLQAPAPPFVHHPVCLPAPSAPSALFAT